MGRWGRVLRIGSVDSSKSCASTDVLKSQIVENDGWKGGWREIAVSSDACWPIRSRSGARPVKILFCPPVSGPRTFMIGGFDGL